MQRLNGPDSVKVISVVEVKAKRGMGIEGDRKRCLKGLVIKG